MEKSMGTDYGLDESLEAIERQRLARERVHQNVKARMASSALDIALSNGQITPGGGILLTGRPRPITLGMGHAPSSQHGEGKGA